MDHKNKVSLVGWYGGDKTHAQAAWTSTQIQGKEERIPGLLRMLAENGHGTPFERSLLHFNATVDTATHIHILKHRHFSVNGESARYKEYTEDKYYVPSDWPNEAREQVSLDAEAAYRSYHASTKLLSERDGLSRKRAKESARFFLPYAIQVTLDFSCNFRAFQHFQNLRNSEHAQVEIREIAQRMLDLVKTETGGAFTYSLGAWNL